MLNISENFILFYFFLLRKTADRDTEWGIDDILDSKKRNYFYVHVRFNNKKQGFFYIY